MTRLKIIKKRVDDKKDRGSKNSKDERVEKTKEKTGEQREQPRRLKKLFGFLHYFRKGSEKKKKNVISKTNKLCKLRKAEKQVKTKKEISNRKMVFPIIFGLVLIVFVVVTYLVYYNGLSMQSIMDLKSDQGILFTFVLLIVLVLLLVVKTVMHKRHEIQKLNEKLGLKKIQTKLKIKPSEGGKKKSFFSLFRFGKKKTELDQAKKIGGAEKTKKTAEAKIKKTAGKKYVGKEKEEFDEKIIGTKRKKINQVMVFILAIGIVAFVITLFMPQILYKIIAAVVIIIPLVVLIKNNKKPENAKQKNKKLEFRAEDYKEMSQVLNKIAELNKKKENIATQLDEISLNLKELGQKRMKLMSIKSGKMDSSLASGITVVRKGETEKETEIKKPSLIITTKMVKSKEFETDMDILLDLVNTKNIVKLSDVSKFFNMEVKKVEVLAKILEEHDLLRVHYPTFGELELRKIEKKGVKTKK